MRDLPDPVAAVFDAMPERTRRRAMWLRAIIVNEGLRMGIGLEETLKWGEPAYLPGRAGTPVRIGWDRGSGAVKLLVHCGTSLVEGWRARFGDDLRLEGNRAVIVAVEAPPSPAILACCVAEALSYRKAGERP